MGAEADVDDDAVVALLVPLLVLPVDAELVTLVVAEELEAAVVAEELTVPSTELTLAVLLVAVETKEQESDENVRTV